MKLKVINVPTMYSRKYSEWCTVSGERNKGCWLRYVDLISKILYLRWSYGCCHHKKKQKQSITISINCWWVPNVKRESRDLTSKPQVDPSSSFGAASLIKPYANFPCEWIKPKTTIKILLQHYHSVFTSPAILNFRHFASVLSFIFGTRRACSQDRKKISP